ncbi:MAG: tRNA-dihydrouridine synthase [Meiothermus sp.]|nr:tRNA-dihydrouridine synthase [Meiothermus sp.]
MGCGDVRSADEYRARLGTGVAGVMIGRGAIGNPWIFRQIASGTPAPTLQERIQTALRHAELNAQWYGEFHGIRQLRKVLYRYLPDNPELHPLLKQVCTLGELKRAFATVEFPAIPELPNDPGYPECGR